MLTRESFRIRFLGLICTLTFLASIILGLTFGSLTYSSLSLDLTGTAICCGNQTIEALIYETQASAVVQTETAKIQPTQTYIADTISTLEAQLESTPTPK